MITEYLYQFFIEIFDASVDSHYGLDFLATACSAMICTLPVYYLLRLLTNSKIATFTYLALQVAFFALQAYSYNGGIL